MSKAIALSIYLLVGSFSWPAAAQPAPSAAGEQRPSLALFSEHLKQSVEAPVLSSSLELEVSGLLARASFTASFANPTEEWMQGVYLFPLPENAAVHGLHMVVGKRVVEGQIAEREAAERSYHSALQSGREAALLSQERPNVFVARVGNIGPRETAIIVIDLDMEVRYASGRFTLRFPTVVGSRYSPPVRCAPAPAPVAAAEDAAPQPLSTPLPQAPPAPAGPLNPLAVHVELDAGVPLAGLTSPSHRLRAEWRSASHVVVDLDGGAVPADRDFVLEWVPVPERAPRAALYVQQRDGERFALVMLVPPAGRSAAAGALLPRETIYVIDTSGSMEGVSIEQARRALLFGLDRLRPGDRFNVIRFSGDMEALFDESAAATPEALEQARAFVRGLRAGGGTEMLPALRAALRPGGSQAAGEFVRQVIFVTDGGVDNEADLFASIRQQLGASRLYTVGIGPTPNNHFLRKAAELGRGSFTAIDRVEQVEERMSALLGALEAPVLHDVELHWSDPAAESWPRLPPDLYEGEALVIASRLGAAGGGGQDAGGVEISGGLGGERWTVALRLDQAVPGQGIDRLWARRKVESLVDSLTEGAAADQVRGEVTGLGLRHRLLTPYTSLVAIDRSPGAERAPSDVEPAASMVPLSVPYGWGPAAGAAGGATAANGAATGPVEDMITVTSESPLLDERRVSVGTTIGNAELARIPAAADPWRILARTPGVLTDRPYAPAGVSGLAVAGPGAGTGQAVVAIDGMELGANTGGTLGAAGGFGMLAAQEVKVETSAGEAAAATPGVRINLTERRGTNEWRGSGLAQGTAGPLAGRRAAGAAAVPPLQAQSGEDLDGNRLRHESAGSLEAGGPLRTDYVWGWATLDHGSESWTAFGGQAASDSRSPLAAKLNAQVADNAALTLSWNRGRQQTAGEGAGPDRTADTTLGGSTRSDTVRLEETQILTAQFYWDANLGAASSAVTTAPRGARAADAAGIGIDAAGVAHGSWFSTGERWSRRGGTLSGQLFFGTGGTNHELQFGGGGRSELGAQDLIPAGSALVLVAGEALGLPRGTAAAAAWREGRVDSELDRWSLWAQDRIEQGRLSALLGLRYDLQTIGLRPSAVPASPFSPLLPAVHFSGDAGGAGAAARLRWQSVSPRLAGTWSLGQDRRLLLRLALGRYAAQLPAALAARLDPTTPASAWYLYDEPRGGLPVGPAGPVGPPAAPGAGAGLRFWVPVGFDPAHPGAVANAVAPGLHPELTDEALLSFEYGPVPDAVLSLTGTWRRIGGVLEERLLVRDAATGRVGPAGAGDWVPAGAVAGVPGGGDQAVPYYDLRPGLAPTGGTLLTNGDRRQRYLGLTLGWVKRLAGGWMSRGHLTWQDWTWQVGPNFTRFADPTPTLALGQSSGAPVVERAGSLLQEPIYLNSRWTAAGSALVMLPWALSASLELTGRQGFPVGYFQPVPRPAAGPVLVQASRRLDAVRYGDLVTLDARLDREIELTSELAFTVTFEALNLLDAGTVLRREANLAVTRAQFIDEVVAPRVLRLGLRVAFR
jgi:Ca-activated chloride channel family protein